MIAFSKCLLSTRYYYKNFKYNIQPSQEAGAVSLPFLQDSEKFTHWSNATQLANPKHNEQVRFLAQCPGRKGGQDGGNVNDSGKGHTVSLPKETPKKEYKL